MKDIGGIMKEQFREYKDQDKYKNYINPEQSDDNIYKDMVEGGCDWYEQIREAKASTQTITGRAVRKDAVVLCSTVESVPPSWDKEVCKEYFEDKADWYQNYLHEKGGTDEGSLKSLVVHLDESTPHATYAWVPVADGKLQAKNIVTREFLRELQQDSQEFTLGWIDKYNSEHQDAQIERLESYVSDSERVHLSESEYKERKIQEHVQEMQQQLESTKEKIGNLEEKKQILETKTQEAELAKEVYETKAELADQSRLEYEDKFVKLTNSPSVQSYQNVVSENHELKEEISLKDRLIEKLQLETQKLKDTLKEWKEAFDNIAHKAGYKLMKAFGYEVSDIKQYPDKDVVSSFVEIKGEVKKYDLRNMRIIPDNENEGMYRLVDRQKDGKYVTIKDNFEDRRNAEEYQKELLEGKINFDTNMSLNDEIKFK